MIRVDTYRFPIAGKPYPGTLTADTINDGMIACWLCNEGSGATTSDKTTPANNATFVNEPTWTVSNGLYPDASYLMLDGVNDYLTVPDGSGLDVTGDFSVFARVYINYDYSLFANIFPQIVARNGASSGGVDGWNLDYPRPGQTGGINQSLRLIFKATGSPWGTDQVVSTTKFASSQWVNVGAVREGGTSRIYINGVLDGTAATSPNPIEYASSTVTELGRKFSSSGVNWHGGLDVIRHWSRALTGAEFSALHLNPYKGIG